MARRNECEEFLKIRNYDEEELKIYEELKVSIEKIYIFTKLHLAIKTKGML